MRNSTKDRKSTSRNVFALCLAMIVLFLGQVALAADPLHVSFANGSEATIYDGDYILENYAYRSEGRLYLAIPGYPLRELTLTPLTSNPKGERYFPHKIDNVVAALDAITFNKPINRVEIYVLPLPRVALTSSSAIKGKIFLSPGARSIPEEVTHMVVTHELGHVFHYAHMDDSNIAAWNEYRQIRDIENHVVYCSSSSHRNRPHEIFAEDFRFLFGGALANYSGNIENSSLSLPSQVTGLSQFIVNLAYSFSKGEGTSVLKAANYPNPFNPETQVTVTAAASALGQSLNVRVFDVQGRLVKTLHTGTLEETEMQFRWDGRDNSGDALPSGVYFSHIRLGEQQISHKMIFVG
ncbi:MAG: T9SS type A sorting domain-containing protein [bacterium]|nr:T9SS type A sorting domain-containing protein [bacterium]